MDASSAVVIAKLPLASRGKCSISATAFLLRLFLTRLILSGLSVINVRDDFYFEAKDLKIPISLNTFVPAISSIACCLTFAIVFSRLKTVSNVWLKMYITSL